MTTITINGISIDPAAPKPALAALSLNNATAKASDYLVVQTSQPLDKTQRGMLAKAGARILEAVPGNAYICYFPKTDLIKVRALPFVTWADIYPQAVKISPSLRSIEPQPGGVLAAAAILERTGELDDARRKVCIVLHRNADPKKTAKRIAAAAHVDPKEVQVVRGKVRLMTKVRRLSDITSLDEVRHVEEVLPRKLLNSIARQVLRVPTGNPAPGAEGAGEIVVVADTGFDKGSTTNVHPAFKGRVKKLYALGRPGRKDDPDGHGTHVAGSVLGNGVSTSEGAVRGTAPMAKLVLQSVLDASSLSDLAHDLGMR